MISMNSKEKFFSNNAIFTKQFFSENFEKLTYQRKLIRDIEKKHKDWSRLISNKTEKD